MGIDFYIGDERLLGLDHPENNYGMIMSTLFEYGVPNDCCFHHIETKTFEPAKIIEAYSGVIPDIIDIGLFGIGDDGHIASIFPNSSAVSEKEEKLVFVKKPNVVNFDRVTVTPKVIFFDTTSFFISAQS